MLAKVLFGVVATFLLLSGCNSAGQVGTKAPEVETTVTDMKAETAILEAEVAEVEQNLSAAEKRIAELENGLQTLHVALLNVNEGGGHIYLSNPTGYVTARSSNGIFFIVLKDVQPYMEGYRLSLKIGNPSYATFDGFELRFRWGVPPIEKTISFTESLRPGSWTAVEAVLADLPKGTSAVEVLVKTDTLSLAR